MAHINHLLTLSVICEPLFHTDAEARAVEIKRTPGTHDVAVLLCVKSANDQQIFVRDLRSLPEYRKTVLAIRDAVLAIPGLHAARLLPGQVVAVLGPPWRITAERTAAAPDEKATFFLDQTPHLVAFGRGLAEGEGAVVWLSPRLLREASAAETLEHRFVTERLDPALRTALETEAIIHWSDKLILQRCAGLLIGVALSERTGDIFLTTDLGDSA